MDLVELVVSVFFLPGHSQVYDQLAGGQLERARCPSCHGNGLPAGGAG